MTVKVEFGEDITLQSWTAADVSWSLTATDVEELISGESDTTDEIDDCIYRNFEEATIHNEVIVGVENQLEGNYSFTSSNTGVATVNSDGRVNWVSDGTTNIKVKGPRGAKKINVAVSDTGGTSTTQFESFVPGSLAYNQATLIAGLVEGKTPTINVNTNIYGTYNLVTNTYIRSENVWTEDLDLTAWLTRVDTGNYYKPATAITPAHILQVGHNPFNPGEVVYFTDNDNVVYSRTVTAIVNLRYGAYQYGLGAYVDFAISTLNSDLPESITPAMIAPADWRDYCPSLEDGPTYTNKGNGIPILYSDRTRAVYTGDCFALYDLSPVDAVGFANPIDTGNDNPRVGWNKTYAVAGDSGNSGCLYIDDRLVVLTNYCAGGNFIGPEMGNTTMIDIIQDITGDRAEIADLTGFTNYA